MLQYNVCLEGKIVLVTGAAGFIGSNLVKRLFHDVKDIKVIKDVEKEHTDSEEKEFQKELKELEKLEKKDSMLKEN